MAEDSYYPKYTTHDTNQEPKKVKLVDNGDGTYSIAVSATISTTETTQKLYNADAWGRPKAIQDFSLFHGIFTYNIPSEMWLKYKNDVEVLTNEDTAEFYSENGKGVIYSNDGSAYLASKRNPRYQPNRGHLYSSSILLPNVNAIATRRWGLFNSSNGVFFELKNGVLYAVVRTSYIDFLLDENSLQLYAENGVKLIDESSSPTEIRQAIATTDINLSKGNIYDIQMQWRGVGNIRFFINLKLIYEFEFLGTLEQLSISNPALCIAMESIKDIDNAYIECGCCDVSSEGGTNENRFFRSVSTSEFIVGITEVPLMAFRIPTTIRGIKNTRDIILSKVGAFAESNSTLKMYYTRNSTAITTTWTPDNDGFQEYAQNGIVTAWDSTKMRLIATRRIPANQSIEISDFNSNGSELFLIAGDYILLTIKAKNANTLCGGFIEFSEEI